MNYQNPAGTRFPIIAQAPVPQSLVNLFSDTSESASDIALSYKKAFERIAHSLSECGFNVALFGSSFEIMDALLDACTAEGVKMILNPVWLNDSPLHTKAVIDHYTSRVNGRPVAWQVFDQPKFYDWGDAVGMDAPEDIVWNNLTVGLWNTRGLDNTRMAYFNLATPEYNEVEHEPDEWIGTCKDYNQYLDALQELYSPVLWSYDLYPFIMRGDSTDIEVRYDHFYKYLKIFSDRALATGAPFWAYAMCQGHSSWEVDSAGRRTKAWTQPVPTEGMLRFEAFNALAFGAQGLVYWQYGQPSDSPATESGLTFGPAPFDFTVNGTGSVKTLTPVTNPVWDKVQTVNKEIQKYADVFLGCTVKNVFHFRQTYAGQPMSDSTDKCISSVECGPGGVLVSEISNGDRNYVVVLNQNPFSEEMIRFSVRAGYQGKILTDDPATSFAISNPSSTSIGRSRRFDRTLAPGGYVIVEWKEYDLYNWELPPIEPSFP